MKLIDALKEIRNDSNKFAVNEINTKILGIRYCKEKDDVISCDRTTGEYVKILPLLVWDYRMLDSDGWEIKNSVAQIKSAVKRGRLRQGGAARLPSAGTGGSK